jgi:SAM-dependent methyltransferase
MVARLFLWLAARSAGIRRLLFRTFFDQLSRHAVTAGWWTFMNYGYAEVDETTPRIVLDPSDERERYCIQLYHHVAASTDFSGKDVLEVSCGRGGGASYLNRRFRPRTLTAFDVAPAAIDFCRRMHHAPGLHFLQGDAEKMPVPDASMDVVIDIESSFCYGDIDRFLAEVCRVLRPGGRFLYADMRFGEELDEWMAAIRRSGLALELVEDITKNVVKALALDSRRRMADNRRLVTWPLRGALSTFAGTEGTRYPILLSSGRLRYLRFILTKPDYTQLSPAFYQATTDRLALPEHVGARRAASQSTGIWQRPPGSGFCAQQRCDTFFIVELNIGSADD